MNTEPIFCTGNDLEGVLAGIRERKGFPDRLECCVGGKNANYKVSYFLAGNKNGEDVKGAPDPSALAIQHSRKLDSLPSIAEPSTISPAEETSCLTAAVVGGAASLSIVVASGDTGGRKPEVADGHASGSIEARLTKLKEKLRYTGKLRLFARKKRIKPATARIPYADH